MTDNLKNRGAQDRARINVHEEHEVRYWTKALGVSEDELKLVKEHGVSAERIREALAQRKKTASQTAKRKPRPGERGFPSRAQLPTDTARSQKI